MLFNKKSLMLLLSVIIALPIQAGPTTSKTTTTTTTTTTGKGAYTISIPQNVVVGGVAALSALGLTALFYGLYKLKKRLGGSDTFEEFLNDAMAQGQKAIDQTNAANKTKMLNSYEPLNEQQQVQIVAETAKNYVVKWAAQKVNVSGEALKSYLESFPGTRFVDQMGAAQAIVGAIGSNNSLAIPGAQPGEDSFKSALRYAVTNKVTDLETAGKLVKSFEPRADLNPVTGKTASDEIGSRVGSMTRGAVDAAGNALTGISTGVAQATSNAAKQVGRQYDLANQAYAGRGNALANAQAQDQAIASNAAKMQSNINSEKAAQRNLVNDVEAASKPVVTNDDLNTTVEDWM
jgi:hypothetical protein